MQPTSSRRPSSSYYTSQIRYPQPLVALPAAYGYLPRQTWPQEYTSMPGGPRAVPLRMQRATMSRTDQHPMPIPSLQLSSGRPYSVPAYLNQPANCEANGNLAHPPRPATSLTLNGIPPRPTIFPHHRVPQEAESDILATSNFTLGESALPAKTSRLTRPVAKRGSKASTSNHNPETLGSTIVSFEQDDNPGVTGQKRMAEPTAVPSSSSKRIKINVVRGQSQIATVPGISMASSISNPGSQELQANKAHRARNILIEKQYIKSPQNPDDNTTQSSDSEDELAEDSLTSKRQGQIGITGSAKPDPYDIDKFDLGKGPQKATDLSNKRGNINGKEINTSHSVPRGSSVALDGLDISNRNITITCQQYTDASSQCDVLPEIISRKTQIEPEEKPECRVESTLSFKDVTSVQDITQNKHIIGSYHSQLSRMEETIGVQRGKGMDEYIKERLSTRGPCLLEMLTNEILIGLVVRDDELLERVVKIM